MSLQQFLHILQFKLSLSKLPLPAPWRCHRKCQIGRQYFEETCQPWCIDKLAPSSIENFAWFLCFTIFASLVLGEKKKREDAAKKKAKAEAEAAANEEQGMADEGLEWEEDEEPWREGEVPWGEGEEPWWWVGRGRASTELCACNWLLCWIWLTPTFPTYGVPWIFDLFAGFLMDALRWALLLRGLALAMNHRTCTWCAFEHKMCNTATQCVQHTGACRCLALPLNQLWAFRQKKTRLLGWTR